MTNGNHTWYTKVQIIDISPANPTVAPLSSHTDDLVLVCQVKTSTILVVVGSNCSQPLPIKVLDTSFRCKQFAHTAQLSDLFLTIFLSKPLQCYSKNVFVTLMENALFAMGAPSPVVPKAKVSLLHSSEASTYTRKEKSRIILLVELTSFLILTLVKLVGKKLS